MSRPVVLLVLSAWLALLLVTHRGKMSPYSYVSQAPAGVAVTRPAASDALNMVPVTRFFYDGTTPDFDRAHNLRLPFHSFATSIVASFVRRYDVANELTNLLFLVLLAAAALRLADRHGLARRAQLLGLATIFALPPVVGYIGQPMQYIVGPVVNALVILVALAAGEERLRNPWFSGALTAILCVNYDWYVFAAALAVYVLAVVRFPNARTAGIYAIVAALPGVLWQRFLEFISDDGLSKAIRNGFIGAVIEGWLEFFSAPGARPLLPVAATQLGFHVAVHEIIALIHWPLIVCCAAALWHYRDTRQPWQARWLLILLVAMFLVEQLTTAAFDWENNPRRALPVVVAFACAYCWSIDVTRGDRRWRIAFVALFLFAAGIAFTDVLLGNAGASVLYMGETIRGPAKIALPWQEGAIIIAPTLQAGYEIFSATFPRAALGSVGGAWIVANLFVAGALVVLFTLLARVDLLPRRAPYVCAAIMLASAIRFLL
ncbi:MAG TPA: hypothetical protein VGF69_25115 [Thermoanaerobaculia bacterium]